MKLAIVVQRFGKDIVGGAESHARQIAYKLKEEGHSVHIITTTASCYRTWENHYSEGKSTEDGLTVFRFPTLFPRFLYFSFFHRIVLYARRKLGHQKPMKFLIKFLEKLWFILQGPYCPKLIRFIEKERDKYDTFIFFTYLYYPTVYGLPRVCDKALLVPTAHDEEAFYFSPIARVLQTPRYLLVNTKAEEKLIERRCQGKNAPIRIAGLGFDELAQTGHISTRSLPQSFALYLGRISHGKGVSELISWFLEFIKEKNSDLVLVLAGNKEEGFNIPSHPHIHYIGFVDNNEKVNLLEKAKLVINPSPLESLSMLVIEAMTLKRPALVNGHCAVLKELSDAGPSILAYEGKNDFFTKLEKIEKTDWNLSLEKSKLDTSYEFTIKTYSWKKVMDVYRRSFSKGGGGGENCTAGIPQKIQ